ncbi:unnamed protein product [Pleuronectes platessa]|uniref:Uncharacterized protein n=1 Tax=Pleuronectes platessa TaxID=8262 RepID=A0A9N7TMT0_PLEPL|nr:unnamed protein product [Pleuronectes platessa]
MPRRWRHRERERGKRARILSRRWSSTFRLVDWSEVVWKPSSSQYVTPSPSPPNGRSLSCPVTTVRLVTLVILHICHRAPRRLWEPLCPLTRRKLSEAVNLARPQHDEWNGNYAGEDLTTPAP